MTRLTTQRWNDNIIQPLLDIVAHGSFFRASGSIDPAGSGSLLDFIPGETETLEHVVRVFPSLKTPGDRLTAQDITRLDEFLYAYQRDLGDEHDRDRLTTQQLEKYESRPPWGLDHLQAAAFNVGPGTSVYWPDEQFFVSYGAFLFNSYAGMSSPNARSWRVRLELYAATDEISAHDPPYHTFTFGGGVVDNEIEDATTGSTVDTEPVFTGGHAHLLVEFMPYEYSGMVASPQATTFMTYRPEIVTLMSPDAVELLTLPF